MQSMELPVTRPELFERDDLWNKMHNGLSHFLCVEYVPCHFSGLLVVITYLKSTGKKFYTWAQVAMLTGLSYHWLPLFQQ